MNKKAIGAALQSVRKANGFKSAKAFAEHMGYNPLTYTDWEQGRHIFSFEQAWEMADALQVTLDELGGRDFPQQGREYADPVQQRMNAAYATLPEDKRASASAAVEGIAAQAVREKTDSEELDALLNKKYKF